MHAHAYTCTHMHAHARICMHMRAHIIESTKTRVTPGFFRGTPPENRGSPHVFSRLPGFFPGIPGGLGMHSNSGGVPRKKPGLTRVLVLSMIGYI